MQGIIKKNIELDAPIVEPKHLVNKEYVDSTAGLSAYEIAVENGFIGTEEEWLESLKGKSPITYGTEDLIPGVSPLETGTIYVVYE